MLINEEEISTKDSSGKEEPAKNVVTGKDFAKLTKKARKLGAESLDYSKRKNTKYEVTLKDGKSVHFGSTKYPNLNTGALTLFENEKWLF